MREREGVVREVRDVADGVSLVSIECVEPARVPCRAGQFISVRLGSGERRSYSIISASGERGSLDIIIKRGAPSGGTAEFLRELAPASAVSFFGPMGYFLFEPGCDELVFGATGVGITPFVPMINEALAASGTVELLWGLRDPADLFLAEWLETVAATGRFSHRIFYSGRGDGHITEAVVARSSAASAEAHIYLCGRQQMISDVLAGIGSRRAAHRLHTEIFY